MRIQVENFSILVYNFSFRPYIVSGRRGRFDSMSALHAKDCEFAPGQGQLREFFLLEARKILVTIFFPVLDPSHIQIIIKS